MGVCASAPADDAGANGMSGAAKAMSAKASRNVRDYYDIGDVLGKGGFAEVKLARHKETGTEYALKIMNLPANPKSADDNTREDVMKEINLLTGLDHPNVIRLYEYFDEKRKFYLVTELLRGGELLQAVIDRERYDERDAKDCFAQMLRGIEYLHSKKITHRDLKLENLMLKEPGSNQVKIVDFGLAKRAAETIMDTVCGTPQYVAPEVISGDDTGTYDSLVDLWSAGVVLYILLGGYPPFHDENEPRLFKKIAHGIYDFDDEVWDKVSDEAKDLIKKLLTVEPSKRLNATEALRHEWFSTDKLYPDLAGTRRNIARTYRKRLKAAVIAVVAQGRVKNLMNNVKAGMERQKSIVSNDRELQKAQEAADYYDRIAQA